MQLRVGGEQTIKVSVRVLSATNRDLSALVEQEKDPSLVLDAFLLRAMSVAGSRPTILAGGHQRASAATSELSPAVPLMSDRR